MYFIIKAIVSQIYIRSANFTYLTFVQFFSEKEIEFHLFISAVALHSYIICVDNILVAATRLCYRGK